MKLLILTQYFPPEVGAPQNRLFELAVRLQKMGAEVTVLTAMPNYPAMEIHEAYRGKMYAYEEMQGVKVHRAFLYVSRSKGIVPRLLNYFSFVFTSLFTGMAKLNRQDVLLCESPPLFLGISAWLLRILFARKLIFNVSDLWPESAEKLGIVKNRFLLGISTVLEEFMYGKSALITGQTQGIVNNISSRFPQKRVYWLKNGVDLAYYRFGHTSSWRAEQGFAEDDFLVGYAGIIGHAQGLEVILKAAQQLKEYKQIKFILVGSGPEKEKLMLMKQEQDIQNVYFLDAQPKSRMPDITSALSAAVIPLKRLDLFKGAIPSKIFENLAMKKPILLGVEGEAKELFIDEGRCGLFFVPEDTDDLAAKVLAFYRDPALVKDCGENGYAYVQKNFTRDAIAADFYKELQTLVPSDARRKTTPA
jgi:glycosyltransferase involved in cell wall biosynthesis